MNTIHKHILKKIKDFDTIVIARHIGPDPDSYASEIALRDIIKLNYPQKKVLAVGTSVAKFKFIGTLDKLENVSIEDSLLIMLDVPRFDRIDGVDYQNFKYTIKIDHHPCEEKVSDLDYVDETSSSVCQLIGELVYDTKLKINENIAATLYLGIVSDSDRFLLSYTTPKTFILASKLLNDYHFELKPLYNNLYERSIKERKFEGYIIENLTITENGFGYIYIDEKVREKFNVDVGDCSNMVNNLNFIKELKVWAFSTYDEKKNIYRINIRSRGIVINEIASKFNGGGHQFASGARIENKEDVDRLFLELDKECAKYK